MRRCNYELSRVIGMRRLLTVMNATDNDRVWNIDEKRKEHRSVNTSQKKAKKAPQKGEAFTS